MLLHISIYAYRLSHVRDNRKVEETTKEPRAIANRPPPPPPPTSLSPEGWSYRYAGVPPRKFNNPLSPEALASLLG